MALEKLRRGMWVVHKGYTAILNDFAESIAKVDLITGVVTPAMHGDVHYVDTDGATVETKFVPLKELSQATLADIPKKRLPSKAHIKAAKAKGY